MTPIFNSLVSSGRDRHSGDASRELVGLQGLAARAGRAPHGPRSVELRVASVDLDGSYLYGATTVGRDLANADLSNTTLNAGDLHDTAFLDANLSNTGLIQANINSSTLMNANLTGAVLDQATLVNSYLSGSELHRRQPQRGKPHRCERQWRGVEEHDVPRRHEQQQ